MNTFPGILGELFGNGLYMSLNAAPLLMSTAAYILTAIGLYALAKRRGIHHAWLSWVPVANVWILGSLADQYRYVTRGQIKSKRIALTVLRVISAALVCILIIMVVSSAAGIASEFFHGHSGDHMLGRAVGTLVHMGGVALTLLPVTIAAAVIRYMALYDVYLSCEPENAVLYLLLSIFFGASSAFILLFLRERDKGMPPRRPRPCAAPRQGTAASPSEAPVQEAESAEQPFDKQVPTGQPAEAKQETEYL